MLLHSFVTRIPERDFDISKRLLNFRHGHCSTSVNGVRAACAYVGLKQSPDGRKKAHCFSNVSTPAARETGKLDQHVMRNSQLKLFRYPLRDRIAFSGTSHAVRFACEYGYHFLQLVGLHPQFVVHQSPCDHCLGLLGLATPACVSQRNCPRYCDGANSPDSRCDIHPVFATRRQTGLPRPYVRNDHAKHRAESNEQYRTTVIKDTSIYLLHSAPHKIFLGILA